ncbi:YceI family protein [Shewanella sedimentimangrovi]|uniref:YceI family protein n=1 Tax=Shewanella sedimentimangrovi TaxID=2814293 RepID=A0ABX7R6G3_9GAMM|nr:YceI family protein [Shewanella sedimentimangrovi]QSX38726.1 YceI family protein [Shewanella sedimentimangrovi]
MKATLTALLLATGTSLVTMASAHAGPWHSVQHKSVISFVSIKKGDVAEVHDFGEFKAQLDGKGHFELEIALSSVRTGLEQRDERMKSMLFEVAQFPTVSLKAKVEMSELEDLAVGAVKMLALDAELSMHGMQANKKITLALAKLSDSRIIASSSAPVIVNGDEFGFAGGIEKLRQVAGLSAISLAVPVNFVLTLEK